MNKYKTGGWYKEPDRHRLARFGVKTGRKIDYFIRKDYGTMQPLAIRSADGLDLSQFYIERKYDGTRIIAYIGKDGDVSLRNRKDFEKFDLYPELKEEWAELSKNGDVVLDGELVILPKGMDLDESFEQLASRDKLGKTNPLIHERSRLYPATFVVFDILEHNNKSLVSEPLSERKRVLKEVFKGKNLKHIKMIDEKEAKDVKEMQEKGFIEGSVLKMKSSPYYEGDSWLWKKFKYIKNNDVVVLGYTPGKNSRTDTFGALVMGVWDDKSKSYIYTGTVGSGFDRSKIKDVMSKLKRSEKPNVSGVPSSKDITWVKPNMVRRVEFLKISPYGIYQQAVDVEERVDITPARTHMFKK